MIRIEVGRHCDKCELPIAGVITIGPIPGWQYLCLNHLEGAGYGVIIIGPSRRSANERRAVEVTAVD
jgi:hypothetical protein